MLHILYSIKMHNKHNSDEKTAIKKASDNDEVRYVCKSSAIRQPSHVTYITHYSMNCFSKQFYSIKQKTVSVYYSNNYSNSLTVYLKAALQFVQVFTHIWHLSFMDWTEDGEYYYIKEDGAPELTYQLHNHHGPIVVWRCLPAREKFSAKLTLTSCSGLFETPEVHCLKSIVAYMLSLYSLSHLLHLHLTWWTRSLSHRVTHL